MKYASITLAAILFLSACGTPGPTATPKPSPTPTPGCDPKTVTALLEEIDAIIEEWDDTNSLANSTGRIALSPVIQKMQDIKRKASELETDGTCVEAVACQEAIVDYMELQIDGYLLFMAQKEDAEVTAKFNEASGAMDESIEAYRALAAYAP